MWLNCKVIKKCQPPPPPFLHQPLPFSGLSPLSSKKIRTPTPKWLNFWKVLPLRLIRVGFQLCWPFFNIIHERCKSFVSCTAPQLIIWNDTSYPTCKFFALEKPRFCLWIWKSSYTPEYHLIIINQCLLLNK